MKISGDFQMTKNQADKKVLQYKDKIFGFALSKTNDLEQAEELSSQIICEVYISLLSKDNIINFDGYIYRIASNVYSKFVHGLIEGRRLSSIDSNLPEGLFATQDHYFYEDNKAELDFLRKEIGYLSQRQRTVVYLFYYENLTVTKIAKALNISVNTVKWHLSDARSTLKEVMIMNYENEKIDITQAINPIYFATMGHYGNPGPNNNDTQTMFDSRIKQNIAWSCYWEPKTLSEIARTIGVPSAYIQDELQKLVDNGYIDQIDNSKNPKFQTNMVIFDSRSNKPAEFSYNLDEEHKNNAHKLCTEYFPKLFEDFAADPEHWGMSCPNNDLNFLKYNLVMATMTFLGQSDESAEIEKLKVKRPDGGNFVAIATVTDDCSNMQEEDSEHWICGYMWNANDYYHCLQLQCKYTERSEDWRNNLFSETLCKFIKNNCNPDALKLEEYENLCKIGIIHKNQVQCAIMHGKNTSIWDQLKPKMAKYETLIASFKDYSQDLDKKVLSKIEKAFPPQALPFIRATKKNLMSSQSMIPYVLEEMLKTGMLKELSPVQKKAVLCIMSI